MPFRRILGAALLLSLSSLLQAAEPAHVAAAERFLALAHADQLTVPVYAQVQQAFARRFAEDGGAGREALLERYQAQANAALDRRIGWKELKPHMLGLYTDTFSQQELEELIRFYQSPVGSKMLRKMPDLTTEAARLTQERVLEVAPEVNGLLNQMSAELAPKKP
jgi:hypothetical protein